METAQLLVSAQGPIEIVSLNRPAALNALSAALVTELSAYVEALKDRPSVRVVILRGEGRAFCAGLDIKDTREAGGETHFQWTWRTQTKIAGLMKTMRSVPQPFIALGHGAACGGGLSLLLASDVRIGAPSLKINAAYIKIGLGRRGYRLLLFPAPAGRCQRGVRITPHRLLHRRRTGAAGGASEQDRG